MYRYIYILSILINYRKIYKFKKKLFKKIIMSNKYEFMWNGPKPEPVHFF